MKKRIFLFAIKLLVSLLVAFSLQFVIFKQINLEPDFKLIILSYILNFLLAFLIVATLSIYINKLKSYIGFLFMFGSLLKFAVFFIWFYPIFKMDGDINGFEFSVFFLPYFICLLFETFELSKMLNKT
ncbi:MAG: hypothetical protein KAI79_11080 [Bacteroidales bacterium]|nr:hypothetical protein [Bacteroidales bacterium]